MSPRIGLLIETDGPGGAESMFLTLARGLRQDGFDVRPVVLGGGMGWLSDRLRQHDFPVFQPLLRRPIDAGLVEALVRWIRRESITVLHSHEFTMSFYAALAGMIRPVPFVMTMHGGTSYASVLRRRVALAAAARSARAVVGVSDRTAVQLSDALWLDRGKITVVPNGVDARYGSRELGRQSLALRSDERLILAVGNLYEIKGHEYLIRAAALLRANTSLSRWKVAIAGRGVEEERLLKLIHELDLSNHVSLLGLRNDVPDLLAAADLVVMPSLSEGLPMAVLEAMFAGKPLIGTNVGGIPELIQNRQSGLLVEPKDSAGLAGAIAEILLGPEQAKIYGKAARQSVTSRYSSSAMIRAYESLYQP